MHNNEICVRSNDAAAIPCARCARAAAAEMGANDRTGTGESQGPLHINPKMRIHKKHYASQLKEQYNTREVVVVYGHRQVNSLA